MEELIGDRKRDFKRTVYGLIADLAAALANARRLELLDLLAQRERDVASLARELGVDPGFIKADLETLANAGVVEPSSGSNDLTYRLSSEPIIDLLVALRMTTFDGAAGRSALLGYRGDREALDADEKEALPARIARGEVVLLDLRPAEEFEAGHIPGARSVPIDSLDEASEGLPAGVEVVTYCRGPLCTWADAGALRLRRRGWSARPMTDGLHEWRRTQTRGSQVQ